MRQYRLDVSFPSALLVIVAVAAWLVLAGVVSAASRPLGWAVASGTVAWLLGPVVARADRHLPHWLAVVVSLLLVAAVFGGAWFGVSATLADNAETIRADAPTAAAELEDRYQLAADFRLEERVSAFVDDLDQRLGTSAQLQRTAGTVPTYVVTGMLMLFLLVYGPRFVEGGLAQIDDPDRRARMAAVADRTAGRARGYVLLTLAKCLVVTGVMWAVLALAGVEAAFLLALLVGGLSALPDLGTVLGALPALLVAGAFHDTSIFVLVVVTVLALQLVDAFVLLPRIEERTLHVGPALPLIVGLVGWELYGLGGAIYGFALLVLLLSLARAVSTDDRGVDVVDVRAPTPPVDADAARPGVETTEQVPSASG